MTEKERKIKVACRLEFVTAYLYGNISASEFVDLVNSGKIFKRLHIKTGDVSAEELERWVCGCFKIMSDEGDTL